MNNGLLLECPECAKEGKKQILGRLMTNGDMLVLRFHHGTTILRASEYQLVCGCGYTYNIQGTIASSVSILYGTVVV